jgi:20S proteasome subunit alpha 3
LKQEFEPDTTKLGDAARLAVKVMHKTMDVTKLTADKSSFLAVSHQTGRSIFFFFPVELATLTRVNNKTVLRVWDNADVAELIKEVDAEEARLESEKKEKEKAIPRKPILK